MSDPVPELSLIVKVLLQRAAQGTAGEFVAALQGSLVNGGAIIFPLEG